MCWSLVFDKVADLEVCHFIEKKLQDRSFPVKFEKFLRTPILKNTCQWLVHDHNESNLQSAFFM